jgi:hypothetical protein
MTNVLLALVDDVKRAVHALEAHLHGDAADLEKTAVRDGEQLAHDAETAAAPVVTEAEHDAEGLAAEAASDAAATVADIAAVSNPTAPAADTPTPAALPAA